MTTESNADPARAATSVDCNLKPSATFAVREPQRIGRVPDRLERRGNSEAAIQGVRPTRWKVFDDTVPASSRIDTVLDWLGEPFLSTRREEGGLGLGIFIANTLLARTGAKVHFDNTQQGARVGLSWPTHDLERAFGETNHDGRRH